EGGEIAWSWTGQGGQPQWLWGGNDGVNMYVYNPANFSVNYANSAGSVGMAGNTNLITGAIRRGRTEWVAGSTHRVVGPDGGQFAVFYPITLWYFNTTIQPGVYEGGHVFGTFSRDNFPDEEFGVFFQVG
ncbi:hypothetical protein, partial [uncultured Bilophila sp.]|uniref:hypothetical protein n=1 Tax=uncultured Bilophila sp. TaxID=529385 RepID=UPI00280A7D76